jgi:hypothetical protein
MCCHTLESVVLLRTHDAFERKVCQGRIIGVPEIIHERKVPLDSTRCLHHCCKTSREFLQCLKWRTKRRPLFEKSWGELYCSCAMSASSWAVTGPASSASDKPPAGSRHRKLIATVLCDWKPMTQNLVSIISVGSKEDAVQTVFQQPAFHLGS